MSEQSTVPRITPSPLCDLLIELLRRMRAGEMAASEFVAEMDRRLADLSKARSEINAGFAKQSEETLERQASNIEAIQFSFQEMEKALNNAKRFAETGDEAAFSVADTAFRKVGGLGRLAFEAYQQSDINEGPTEMPMVNALYRAKEQVFLGAIGKEVFQNLIHNIVTNTNVAIAELQQDKQAPEGYARDTLIRAYERFADDVEALEPVIEVGEGAVDAALEDVVDTGRAVRKAMEAYTMHRATDGPSKMAHANFVLNMASLWREERLPQEVFCRGMEVFRKSTDDLWHEIEGIATIPCEGQGIGEQMDCARKAFESHFAALDMFQRCVNGENELYEEAFNMLVSAANSLADCKEMFDKMGETVGKIPCVRCGSFNEPGNRSCASCGAHLFVPSSFDGSSSTLSFQEDGGQVQYGGELVMTKNLVKVFETVNRAAENRITADEYASVLDWFRQLVEDNLINMPPEPELDDSSLNEEEKQQLWAIQEQIAGAREEIDAGAHGMVNAIETLREFITDTNSWHLVEGVRELRDASIVVQKSAREVEELVKACKKAGGLDYEDTKPAASQAQEPGRVEAADEAPEAEDRRY